MSATHQKIRLQEITKSDIGKKVQSFGWIQAIRSAGKAGTFVDLYFSFTTVKCLFAPDICTKNMTPHSSVSFVGDVQENRSTKDSFPFEIYVTSCEIYAIAPSFPVNKESSAYTLLHLGHLNLQTKERILFLKARNELLKSIRDFYYSNYYIEITPPTLVQTQVEGGSTLFHLNYYGEDAYLTQSSQLYLETVVPSAGRAYCIMPSYRAEKFNTSRHLSEYTHVEAEIGDISFDDLLVEIEALVKYVVGEFYKKIYDEIVKVDPEYKKVEIDEPFKKISYSDAIETLVKHNVYKDKEQKIAYAYGDDISDRDEIELVRILGGKPVFLIHFPVEHKPFYCRKVDPEEVSDVNASMKNLSLRKATESVDLLWPQIGEILGGSMRAEKHDELMEGFKREGIDPAKYYWYTDLRLYGASRHGGYGLGFERFMRAMMGYENVNKSCLYPRFPGRCEP